MFTTKTVKSTILAIALTAFFSHFASQGFAQVDKAQNAYTAIQAQQSNSEPVVIR